MVGTGRRRSPSVSNSREKVGVQTGGRNANKTQTPSGNAPGPALTKVDYTCPLCMEEMDDTDRKFFPCKCRYQICLWCFYHVRDQLDNKCPACRQQYENSLTSRPSCRDLELPSKDEGFNWCGNTVSRTTATEDKEPQSGSPESDDRINKLFGSSNLEDMRIIQRNLVYVVGLSYSVAKREILSCENSFGKYGKILSMRILPNNNDTCSAFITYYDELSATKAIRNINGKKMFGQNVIRCSFGTNKYCNNFIRNSVCTNPNCAYVHEMVDSNDCISKSELINFHSSYKFALKPLRELKQNSRSGQEVPSKGGDKRHLKNKGRRSYTSNAQGKRYNHAAKSQEDDDSRELQDSEENEGSQNSQSHLETQLSDQHTPSSLELSEQDGRCAYNKGLRATASLDRQEPEGLFSPVHEDPGGPSEKMRGNPPRGAGGMERRREKPEQVGDQLCAKREDQTDNSTAKSFHSTNTHKSKGFLLGAQEGMYAVAQTTSPNNIYYYPALSSSRSKEEKLVNTQYSRSSHHHAIAHTVHMQKSQHPVVPFPNHHLENHTSLNQANIQTHMYPLIGAGTPHNPTEYADTISQDGESLELEIKNNIEKMIEDTCEDAPRAQERQTPLINLNSLENGQSFHSIFSNQMGQNCASNNRRTFSDVQAGIIQGLPSEDIGQQIKAGSSSLRSGISILRAIMPHANITIQGR